MGADQSKLRSWTRATLSSRSEEPEAKTSIPSSDEVSQIAEDQAPITQEKSPDEGQVDALNDPMSASTALANEESSNTSLSEYRKLVQSLRSSQGALGSSDAQILEEMERAGVSDMRPGNADQNDAQHDDDQEEDSYSESDSDASSSTDSASDADVPIHAQVEEDDEGLDASVPPRTKNEFGDDYIVEPAIQKISEKDIPSLERIGWVHSIVSNVVLVEQDSTHMS
ncbi:hypothetical protein MCAP1_001051 [Malassezia caprae]|uniref:Uncharacterized protein n=1 Tax=Malassezia caprae TaxID=1381934 RepID=A0AAF0E578_9BASI|nr:hypothetical protein MCAP1_001051 [Malassezia caprae]